jgi:Tol biopolymer transport system component
VWSGDELNSRLLVSNALTKTPPRILNRGAMPAYSPDGSKLAYTEYRESDRTTRKNGGCELKVRDLSTGATTTLNPGTESGGYRFSWSPDGRKIAVDGGLGTSYGGRDRELLVITVADRSVEKIGIGHFPSWSPDGGKIAFVGQDEIRHPYPGWLSAPGRNSREQRR